MTTMITFNELRQIKDMLPSGSMQKIVKLDDTTILEKAKEMLEC